MQPVSTHSRPKAAGTQGNALGSATTVSTHSRPKAAGSRAESNEQVSFVSTHSRPKAAGLTHLLAGEYIRVSTHSRPKAAGEVPGVSRAWAVPFQLTAARRRLVRPSTAAACGHAFQLTAARRRLAAHHHHKFAETCFNSQPPEGGWSISTANKTIIVNVSTHSRPKAAGTGDVGHTPYVNVSTHSRPKAAGFLRLQCVLLFARFNSQPPEGGWMNGAIGAVLLAEFQLTAARRRLEPRPMRYQTDKKFQLTAARRRLA